MDDKEQILELIKAKEEQITQRNKHIKLLENIILDNEITINRLEYQIKELKKDLQILYEDKNNE